MCSLYIFPLSFQQDHKCSHLEKAWLLWKLSRQDVRGIINNHKAELYDYGAVEISLSAASQSLSDCAL